MSLARRFAPVALAAAVHASFGGAVCAVMLVPTAAHAQQQDLIARGRALFEDQQYEESIQTLSAALLRPNLNKQQKLEVYRLMALNFITLNRKDEAESAVRGLLSQEPGYELPKNESPRFRDFFSNAKKKWEAEGQPGLVKEGSPTVVQAAPVAMQHASPSQVAPGTEIPLTIKMEDPQGRVYDLKMFYRTGSKGKFNETATPIDAGTGKATIPKDAVKPPLVEYYFQGFDKGGLPVVSRGDAAAPLRVAVPEPSKGWVWPVVIGGGVLAAGAIIAIVAGVALGGASSKATVAVSVTE